MPQASCNACIAIYANDIEICRCDPSVSSQDCGHWRPHQAEINGLCQSALVGCRMCSELWRFFFKEKTPEQYARQPELTVVPGSGAQAASTELAGPGFVIGPTVQVFHNSGIWYRVVELFAEPPENGTTSTGQGDSESDWEVVLALDFGISSPMIHEVEERRYMLRKTSDRYRLMTLHMAGLLRLDEGSEPELQDISKLRWEWVHAWMAECASEAHHKTCSKALQAIQATSWFPTRIVDVREKLDDDGRKRYMLLETATTAPEGHRYATLSHIWGSEQQPAYRTLRVNYEARLRDGISRDILPPCFQDAIDVAARLKIPYIWIDSLCIIQDDPVDGPTEAGSMDKVYTNSFLNLSATASSSSKDRLPSVAKNDRLQEPRFTGTNWTRRYKGVYQIFDPHFWADRVTQTRLASRGWIFQERALAPRVLHFGFDQLLWECPESERAEEFPLGIPEHLVNNYRRGFKWHMNTSSLQDDGDDDSAATGEAIANDEQQRLLHQKWATITASYTRCELTRATDKLVAISGVAQVLAHRFSDTYLAGLWSSNLIGGLCWQVPKMRRTTQNLVPSGLYARRWEISRRLADNNAPSWSWASVDGEVETGPFVADETEPFQLKNGQEGYKIVRSLVTTAPSITVVPKTTKNSFGEVDTQRTRLQLHVNIMFALEAKASESRLEKQLSLFEFYYAGTTQTAAIKLDQPEELDSVQDALFIPLVLVQTHIYALANVTKVSHEGDVDFNLVMGIVVVPAGFSSSGAVHRRIGFHQCPLDVLSASGLVSLEGVVQLG